MPVSRGSALSTRHSVASLVCDARASIGESPILSSDGVRWTDPVQQRLHRLGLDGAHSTIAVQQSIWSLAAPADGVVGTLTDRFCEVSSDGTVKSGPPAPLTAGCRLNDMAVDQEGGIWAGAMHKGLLATRGAIFHAPSPTDVPTEVASGLGVPNGMAFSSDGRTLYVIDTLARTLLAYPVSGHELGEPVIVTDFLGLPGKPDGMTIGSDGSYWVAMWGGSCVAHIAGDGGTLELLDIPAPHVSSVCVLDESTLFVSTSRMRLSPATLTQYPSSGGLFRIDLGKLS